MAKRGPKAKPNHLKAVAGTNQKCRTTETVVAPLEGEVCLPVDFTTLKEQKPKFAERVLAIWNSKIEIYRARQQSVVGCEAALYQYCLLEAAINDGYERDGGVPTAMISQHRVYANEFYDTPASQVTTGNGSGGNRFGNNGKPRRP